MADDSHYDKSAADYAVNFIECLFAHLLCCMNDGLSVALRDSVTVWNRMPHFPQTGRQADIAQPVYSVLQ